MESPGQYLKKERELRGVSLDQIATATKIGLRFLEAIENDEFESLPADPFTRGFLRSYARYLGLDSDETILLYDQYLNGTDRHPAPPELEVRPAKGLLRKKRRSVWVVVPVIVVAAIVVVGLVMVQFRPDLKRPIAGLSQGIRGIGTQETRVAVQEETEPVQEVGAVPAGELLPADPQGYRPELGLPPEIAKISAVLEPMGKAPQMGKNSEVKVHPIFSEVSAPGEPDSEKVMTLEVQAKMDTWVEVKVDEAEVDDRVLLLSGESRSWYGTDRFTLTLGNVRGVALRLNGEAVSLPETSDNFLSDFALTRDLLR